jgi:hypothetical protein
MLFLAEGTFACIEVPETRIRSSGLGTFRLFAGRPTALMSCAPSYVLSEAIWWSLLEPALAVSLAFEPPFGLPDDAIPYEDCLPNVRGFVKLVCGTFANDCTGTLVGCAIVVGGIEGLLGPVPNTVLPDGTNSPGAVSSSGSSSSARSTMLSRQSLGILTAKSENVKLGSSAQGWSFQIVEVEWKAVCELTLATSWCLDQTDASIWT